MQYSTVNGKEIQHLDVIRLGEKGLKLGFISRIKILFGIPFNIEVNVYTNHQHCHVVDAELKITTDKIEPWPVNTKLTVPAGAKRLYQKWRNSIYRLLLAFVSCFYMGYVLIFDDPRKHVVFIKIMGVLFIIKGIDIFIEFYLKRLLIAISKKSKK